MHKAKKMRLTDFDVDLKKDLKKASFRKHYEREGYRLRVALLITELRKRKHVTQVELAKALETNQSAIARIESGKENVTLDTLVRVADAFDKKLRIQFI